MNKLEQEIQEAREGVQMFESKVEVAQAYLNGLLAAKAIYDTPQHIVYSDRVARDGVITEEKHSNARYDDNANFKGDFVWSSNRSVDL